MLPNSALNGTSRWYNLLYSSDDIMIIILNWKWQNPFHNRMKSLLKVEFIVQFRLYLKHVCMNHYQVFLQKGESALLHWWHHTKLKRIGWSDVVTWMNVILWWYGSCTLIVWKMHMLSVTGSPGPDLIILRPLWCSWNIADCTLNLTHATIFLSWCDKGAYSCHLWRTILQVHCPVRIFNSWDPSENSSMAKQSATVLKKNPS